MSATVLCATCGAEIFIGARCASCLFDEAQARGDVRTCGGSGRITPEAKAEIVAFGAHIAEHRAQTVEGCRFCAERNERKQRRVVTP